MLCGLLLFYLERIDTSEAITEQEISENIQLKYLLPTTSGPGVLTTALVDHLIVTHNHFIKKSRKFIEDTSNQ